MVFDDLIQKLTDYTDQWSILGIIRLCVDCALLIITIF